jgi:hypothetical protein
VQDVKKNLEEAVNSGRFYFDVYINSEDHKTVNTSGHLSSLAREDG